MQDDLLEEIHAKYRMNDSKKYMKNTGGLTRRNACKIQDGLLVERHTKYRMTYSKKYMQNRE